MDRARRRGTVYPYELIRLVRQVRRTLSGSRASSPETVDLDRPRPVPVERAPGANTPTWSSGWSARRRSGIRRRCAGWCCWATRPARWGRWPSGMPPDPRGHRAAGAAPARPGGVVRHLGGREDRDELRHRDHGLDLRALRGIIEFTQEKLGKIDAGDRHQRRRPAVLERRGDDAHAHPGRADHDAGLGHGADREAVARLLRRGIGRGRFRHWPLDGIVDRTARPSTGRPTCPARSTCCWRTTSTRISPRASALPAGSDHRPRRPGYLRVAARRPGLGTLGEIFDPASNPSAEPFDMRSLYRRRGRRRSPAASTLGRHGRRRVGAGAGRRAPRQAVALAFGFESRPLTRHGFHPVDGPSQMNGRHAVPALKEAARAINAATGTARW